MLRHLSGPQRPGDVGTVAFLVNRCHKRSLALSLELGAELAVQGLLIGFNRQQEGQRKPILKNLINLSVELIIFRG